MNTFNLSELNSFKNADNFSYFRDWVIDFFKREYLRESNRLEEYDVSDLFGSAMRPAVSYWNPNRSKHAEVFWLENFVFNQETSMKNKILNAMAVKFVGMPTLTLVATDSSDYSNIINFDEYSKHEEYYDFINKNLDENRFKTKVWGATQLQTSLQTAARNFVRIQEQNEEAPFKLSHMIRWIEELDRQGMSDVVQNPESKLKDVCDWLLQHRGIGPYFSYHPPCNFSRSIDLSHIDEDEDYCLVGPGAKRGLEFVFPDVKFSNNSIMEKFIVSVKKHQYEFFDLKDSDLFWFQNNLERGGKLTTFGTEITFCQFNCFLGIKDNPKAQEKRMLPLTFDSFFDIASQIEEKKSGSTLDSFFV